MQTARTFIACWLPGTAAFCLTVGMPIISYTFGHFVTALHEAFGWCRSRVSLRLSLTLLAVTRSQPLLGHLTDRFDASWLTLSLLSPSLWHFDLLYFLLGITGGSVGPFPFAAVLSHSYEYGRRLGPDSFRLTPLTHALIESSGWRASFTVLGVLVWVIVLSCAGLLIQNRPEFYGVVPDDGRPGQTRRWPRGLTPQPV